MRHITEAGLKLIQDHEGLRLKAYPDPGSGGEPWTIGFGHTGNVQAGDVCTEADALAWLRDDVAWAERCVERAIGTAVATDNEFEAMVSLAFNVGCANFQKSTVLRLVIEGSENEDLYRHAFKLWSKASGKEMAGLVKRRADEAEHFLT